MQVNGFVFGPTFEDPVRPRLAAWDGDGLGFGDLLDVVNPLQHLPLVGSVYRDRTGDEIGGVARLLGGLLFGGPLGLVAAAVNLAVKALTGNDLGGHLTAAWQGRPEPVLGREERMLAWTPDTGWQGPARPQVAANAAYRRVATLDLPPRPPLMVRDA